MNTSIKKTLTLGLLIVCLSFIPHFISVARSAGPDWIATIWDVDSLPGIQMGTFWNNKERASVDPNNPYHPDNESWEEWTEPRLTIADTFQWAIKEILVDIDVRARIPADSQISLYNTQTSHPLKPDGSCCTTDYPPHVNFHYHWSNSSTTEPGWDADQNGHLSGEPATRNGVEVGFIYRYKFNNTNACGKPNIVTLDPDEWNVRLRKDCSPLMEERFTADGEYQLRVDGDSPLYSARSEEGINNVNIYKDDTLIFSVYRSEYVFTSSQAKRVYTVKDLRRNKLITETILSDPNDGHILSHTVSEEDLSTDPAPSHDLDRPKFCPQQSSGKSPSLHDYQDDSVSDSGSLCRITCSAQHPMTNWLPLFDDLCPRFC